MNSINDLIEKLYMDCNSLNAIACIPKNPHRMVLLGIESRIFQAIDILEETTEQRNEK